MSRHPSFLLAAGLILCCAGARAADTWLRLDTPHFEVAGNVGEGDLKRVALKFERFRDVLDQVLGNIPPAGSPPRIFVFKDRGTYRPYLPVVDGKPVEVGGYFQPGRARPYITLVLPRPAEDPYHVVFHEYVHLLNSQAHGPPWFAEGYAEFLAGCVIEGDKVLLGRPNESHIWTLRTNQPLPLPSLLSIPVPAHDRPRQRLFYAQSWLLVHYLMTERVRGREQMVEFLSLAPSAQATPDAFRQTFGVDFAEMEKELKRYVEGSTMSYYNVPIAKAALSRDFAARRVPMLEADALLADLVAQLPEREAEGRGRLERVLQQEPTLAVAQEAMAALGRPPAVFRLVHGVTDAVENALAQELTALSARVSEVMVNDKPPAASASAELEAAVRAFTERSPSSAEGFMMLAHLRRKLGAQPDEVVALLEKAVAAEPAAMSPRLALSQVYRARQDVDAARRVLNEGAVLAKDPGAQAVYVRELEALKPLHRIRGFLVDLHCDPSGRLDFVVEEEGGRRLTLRAANGLAFTVLRNGQSVQESLSCGKQRRRMLVNYKDLSAPEPGVDGTLASLSVEEP